MNFISLDLEMNKPSNKIIMLGACVGCLETGEILETLRCYIKIDEPIDPFINTLTNISDHQIQTLGVSLLEAYGLLKNLYTKHSCHKSPIQWGEGDSRKLKEDLIKEGMNPSDWIFGWRVFDVKTVYQAYCMANQMKLQAGLAKAMTKIGLNFVGTKHDGMDDAVNTFRTFIELLKLIRK
jgi:inhibitor of KinA sporulation pathway (predicted exonuclease)